MTDMDYLRFNHFDIFIEYIKIQIVTPGFERAVGVRYRLIHILCKLLMSGKKIICMGK